jgi:hypothetical protein
MRVTGVMVESVGSKRRTLMAGMTLVLIAAPASAFSASGRGQAPAGSSGQTSAAPAPPDGVTTVISPAPTLPIRIEPKAQLILDRTLQALGGPAFLNAKTLTTHGRLFSINEGAASAFVYFDNELQFPDKRRLSYGLGKKGKPITVINNGDLGWEIDRMGMVHLDSAEIRQWRFANRYSLENLLRLRVHEAGVLVQTAGVDFVDNVNVDILDIVDAQQTEVKLYLNKQTDLPVKIRYRKWDPTINDWNEYSDVYSDYQTFQGIVTPKRMTRSLNDRRISEVYRDSATYNEVYPPQLFMDPGAPP